MRTSPNDLVELTSPPRSRPREDSERRCILSGERANPNDLIRLALSSEGDVLPDVRARAPGRGAWLGIDRAALDAASAKGKLKAALARAFKDTITPPDELGARIEAALARDALDRLGLEAKAGRVLLGGARIEAAARLGQVALLLHAADASADGARKLDQAWRVGQGVEGSGARGMTIPCDRHILGSALGRENAVHVAITDQAAARRIADVTVRWRRFAGVADGSEPESLGIE